MLKELLFQSTTIQLQKIPNSKVSSSKRSCQKCCDTSEELKNKLFEVKKIFGSALCRNLVEN